MVKTKTAAKVRALVQQELTLAKASLDYSVITITFSDGKAIDIPFQPWRPRQSVSLPGRWEKDE